MGLQETGMAHVPVCLWMRVCRHKHFTQREARLRRILSLHQHRHKDGAIA